MSKLLALYTKVTTPLKNEKGAQSLEWLGIAALLILVLGIISTAVSNQSGGIEQIISKIITKIGNMVG
ncbi:hypothetical protein [Saliterribacillus persicus]|uniref:Pilus assembly protein Flp/PilA n=1 Tax=Saliterribacillus persicus TaxID=930114 RepID=A0A368XCX9_9BACI|nr:hypothetical protein [Saliterribacillus persicus]RCW65842.1 hypothetical protein DFR57_11059 [Saliterribacillus persicus]